MPKFAEFANFRKISNERLVRLMNFARKVWKLLVALKDGLALLLLLLFFAALYGALAARPGPGQVKEGALLLDLRGSVVEEPSAVDPLSLLLSGESPLREYRARDVARAIRLAAKDDRIKAVVLDLSGFLGAGAVHLQDIGEAMDEVRAAKKPVLTYATAYFDDSVRLAAHASEALGQALGVARVEKRIGEAVGLVCPSAMRFFRGRAGSHAVCGHVEA